MKFKNLLSRFTSVLMIMVLVFSFVACGDSSDSKEKDEKEEEKVEDVKFEDVVEVAVSGDAGVITSDIINEISEDDIITYEEVEDLFKQIPSSKAEAEIKVDFSMLMEAEGEESFDETLEGIFTLVMEYDNENIAFHMGMTYDIYDESDSLDLWLVNEDGTYYMYEKESGDIAYRREIGNIKEAFGEGIDLNELQSEFEAEMDEYIDIYEEMFASAEDFSNSELITELSEFINVKSDGDFYEMVMDFSASKIIDLAFESEDLATIFEEAGVDMADLEECLDMDIIEDVLSVQELADMINFDINYTFDIKDLFLTELEIDLADCANEIADFFEDYLLEMAEEQDVENPTIEFNFSDAYIKYDFDKNADVTVEFDGEYEEYDFYDNYYDNANSTLVVPEY